MIYSIKKAPSLIEWSISPMSSARRKLLIVLPLARDPLLSVPSMVLLHLETSCIVEAASPSHGNHDVINHLSCSVSR